MEKSPFIRLNFDSENNGRPKDSSDFFVAVVEKPRPFYNPVNVPELELKKISAVRYSKPKQKNIISLSSVFIDPELLPQEKLTACLESVLRSPGISEFNDPQGMLALREKIASRLRHRGMDVEADHIIITSGSQQAIDLVTRTLATQVIATEDPAYWLGKYLFEMNGIKTVGLPIDPFNGLIEKIWQERLSESRPGLVYLTTNFQNPNGYSYTSTEISKIAHWARELNFGILEDDWASEMLSCSELKPSLRATYGENVLYINSFTKKLFPSLRIGYLAANAKTIEPLLMAKRASTGATPGLIEAALFEFLDRGYYDSHLKTLQEELDIRYANCLNLLREFMPEEVKWTTPGGGPALWLELPKRVDLDTLQLNLKNQGILIQLSTNAFFQKPHSHGFRIGYALLTRSEMDMGIEKLSKEIKKQMCV